MKPFHRRAEYTGTGVCVEIIFINRNGGMAEGGRYTCVVYTDVMSPPEARA